MYILQYMYILKYFNIICMCIYLTLLGWMITHNVLDMKDHQKNHLYHRFFDLENHENLEETAPIISNMNRLGNLVDFLCLARFQLDPLGRPFGAFILVATAFVIFPARCSNWDCQGEIHCKIRFVYGNLTWLSYRIFFETAHPPTLARTSPKRAQTHLKRCTRHCGP